MKNITITAEQIEKMLKKCEEGEKRWRAALSRKDENRARQYASELNAMYDLLDIAGIEY